eukprot:TRINITY_DN2375_c0_g1_i1.p1 TRINITY_DN2375_c0_g1~~TRINITY_DN2375_c0_g1_i1.p1  ORF type:complete len:379 (-),score=58.44 TRINITY_DN2375_c0_g1_i1:698-1834(-)
MQEDKMNSSTEVIENELDNLRKKMELLESELVRERELRRMERIGRTTAEKKLRLLSRRDDKETNNTEIEEGGVHQIQEQEPKEKEIEHEGEMVLRPIGYLRSCFRTRNGTPRQGGLVPSSRALLALDPCLNESCLEGLSSFSHVWLIFSFHDNTNSYKVTTHSSVVQEQSSEEQKIEKQMTKEKKEQTRKGKINYFANIKAKIKPPRLKGEKVGLFSTRTPHRPNAIGLSLVHLDKIVKNVLYLSALDLIDGTPIFDVKPYVPEYDHLPQETVKIPEWMRITEQVTYNEVVFSPNAKQAIAQFISEGRCQFYDQTDIVQNVITEIISLDIRSLNQKNVQANRVLGEYNFQVDNLFVEFGFEDGKAFVKEISLKTNSWK